MLKLITIKQTVVKNAQAISGLLYFTSWILM